MPSPLNEDVALAAMTPSRNIIPSGNTSRLVRMIHEGMTVAERRALAEELLPFRREEVDDVERKAATYRTWKRHVPPEGYIEQVSQLFAQVTREAEQLDHPELEDLKYVWDDMRGRLESPHALSMRTRSDSPKRIDTTDNRAYTLRQYRAHYGELADTRWEESEPVTRCPVCCRNFRSSKIKMHAAACVVTSP